MNMSHQYGELPTTILKVIGKRFPKLVKMSVLFIKINVNQIYILNSS